MNRPRSALAAATIAVAFLGGCSGKDASQSSVQEKVEDLLTNQDDRPENLLYPGVPLGAAEAAGAAACVAQGVFDPNNFSKDDRNDITSAVDADLPRTSVIERFQDIVQTCVDEATAVAPEGPGVDDDESTTTERQTSNDD